jgi:hypothetical protein
VGKRVGKVVYRMGKMVPKRKVDEGGEVVHGLVKMRTGEERKVGEGWGEEIEGLVECLAKGEVSEEGEEGKGLVEGVYSPLIME